MSVGQDFWNAYVVVSLNTGACCYTVSKYVLYVAIAAALVLTLVLGSVGLVFTSRGEPQDTQFAGTTGAHGRGVHQPPASSRGFYSSTCQWHPQGRSGLLWVQTSDTLRVQCLR